MVVSLRLLYLIFGQVLSLLTLLGRTTSANNIELVSAENLVTVSEQHLLGGQPQHHRPDKSQHDHPLWPSDSST
jgi:hypothetical protein